MPGHETDSLCHIAIEQLESAAADDESFFMLLSFQAPHPPCSPPTEFLKPYENIDLLTEANADREAWFKHGAWKADYSAQRFRQLYFGEVSQLDAAFGRLLEALDRLDLRDNTLVVFTSDHGEMAGAHGRFGKGVMYEEALHVPLIVSAPGQQGGRRIGTPVSTVDIMPTLLDYAGYDAAGPYEGVSLRPVIEGEMADGDRIVISEYRDFCATTQRWKLSTDGRKLEPAALYDLGADPYELSNRVDDPACEEVQAQLLQALSLWRARVDSSEPQPGEPSFIHTQSESDPAWHPINT